MRRSSLQSLRHLQRTPARASHVQWSSHRPIQLSSCRWASSSTSTPTEQKPATPSAAAAAARKPTSAAPTRKPASTSQPTRRPATTPYRKPYLNRASPMTTDQVDTSLPPLPTIPTPSSTSSPPRQTPDFVSSLSQSSASAPSPDDPSIDWSQSFHGLSTTAFEPQVAAVLMAPLNSDDIEIKPDGILYLPEIKYRRILNTAFGPGGWGLAPRGELVVGEKVVTREYALVVHGRFVAQARGECQYFGPDSVPAAAEGCKSNALSRCCKDLGVASELWDPRFLRNFKKQFCKEIWVEHVVSKKKKKIWTRKDTEPQYPFAVSS